MTARICVECGCELPDETAEGLCPGCLLAGAIKLPPEAGREISPALKALLESPVEDPGEQPGDVIDRYRLLEQVGEGGMGVVYRAEQIEPLRREVALKIIKLGMDTREVIARFDTERQALALMDHAHIAHMFDAGATGSGRSYFVMELVEGIPITAFCDQNKLKVRERLELFLQVCEAIQHAHQKGVIHRDIKPSNVLVTLQDGVPVSKVIDFGVAKATRQRLIERTLFTRSGQMIGTPEYMSPEQAEMSNLDVDTRSDVYSLGVLLYELLTGAPPFTPAELRDAGLHEVCRIIREVEPPKPSTRIGALGAGLTMVAERRSTGPKKLGGQVRGELDWVVMKTLEKDRTRRYEAVSSLGEDIRHYLSGEPVEVGPPTAIYRLRKLVRRHKRVLAAVVLVFLTLMAGVITTSWQAVRASRAEGQAQEDAAIARAVNAFISRDLLSQADPAKEPDRDVKLREVLDRAAAKVGERFKDQPLVEAAIRMTLGDTYSGLGAYAAAETHLRHALEIRKQVLGEEHPQTLAAGNSLALVYLNQGRYREAEEILRQVVEIAKRALDADHPHALKARSNLAIIYRDQGRYPEAEALNLELLEIRKRILGEDHPDTLASLGNLATVYWAQGRYPETEELLLKVLEIKKRVLGEEHPKTLLSLDNLAGFYLKIGRHSEAEEIHLKVIESRKKLLGEEHPDTLGTLSNLALLYNKLGRYSEAEEMYLKVVEAYKKALGEDHPNALKARHNLAMVLGRQGRYAEAEDSYLKVVEIGEKALGEEHPITLFTMNSLAGIYWKQGRYPEAEKIYLQVVAIRKRILGGEHPETLSTEISLATVYWLQRRFPEAEDLFSRVLAKQKELNLPGKLLTQGNLALVYKDQGRYAEAEALHLEVLEIRNKALGDEHPSTLDTKHNLAIVYESQGRYAEAEALNLEVREIRKRVLGDEHPDTLKSLLNLADCHIGLARYPEAEELALKVVEIAKKILGEEHPVTLSALSSMAKARMKQGHYELKPEYYAGYLNRAERYIMTGKYVEAADSLDECLPLAQETQGTLVWNYLRAVSACLLDQSTTEYETGLDSATKEDSGMAWSFEELASWLTEAEVSAEKKTFIAELTEKAKQEPR